MITRRNFIQMFGLTTVAGLSLNSHVNIFGQARGTGELFSVPAESLNDPVASFTSAHFTPFIDTDFQLRLDDSSETRFLRLADVKVFQRKENLAKGVTGESFSLDFRGSLPENPDGKTFAFFHASLGEFTLFLVPVGKEPERFEAIVNHLKLEA